MDWNAGIWSLVPAIIAIALALITKEVVFSLILGVLSGTAIYSFTNGTGVVGIFDSTITLMTEKLGGNASMILFLCFLGILVTLVTRAGGSKAYGEWASKRLKGPRSAALATSGLSLVFFIDDYFNCLTVGTVMRPVADKFRISREKLAYMIDATAAPICIIAPISSWAASVISYFPENASMSGMEAFLSSIPLNLYAVLTLIMVIYIDATRRDFGPMLKAERLCMAGEFSGTADTSAEDELKKHVKENSTGTVIDLILPILVLIIASVSSMLYVGGLWDGTGKTIFDAFGNTVASDALALAGFIALIFTFIFYSIRKVLNFKEFFGCINDGVSSMVPACVILTLAWTIGGVCRDLLNTGGFVASAVETSGVPVQLLAPIIFLVACLLSFATGTAWGTFGILIPIVISITEIAAPALTIPCLSATLAGSVFGDHCSPISDTTILASTGAQCNHLKHVATQAPYAVTVAICCFIGYFVAGFTSQLGLAMSTVLTLGVSIILLAILLFILPKVWGDKQLDKELAKEKV